MTEEGPVPDSVADQLAWFYWRNGYARRQNVERLEAEGSQRYRKGDEVRLVADSEAELEQIRGLLRAAGFAPGRPFAKGGQFRQPVYGRKEVARFLALVEDS